MEDYKNASHEFLIDRMQNKHFDGFTLYQLVQGEILNLNAIMLRIISGITKIANDLKDSKTDLEILSNHLIKYSCFLKQAKAIKHLSEGTA